MHNYAYAELQLHATTRMKPTGKNVKIKNQETQSKQYRIPIAKTWNR